MPSKLPVVGFDVLLRTQRGGQQPHLETIGNFRPDPDAVERCRKWLVAHGVTCTPANFSLACSAPGQLFASLFGVQVLPNPQNGPGKPAVLLKGTIRLPSEIAEWVDQVTLTAPPEFFP